MSMISRVSSGEVIVLGGDVRARDDVNGMGDIYAICIEL